MSHCDQFFPPIGQLAERAEDLQEQPTASDGDAQEDRPLQEVESLCMRCGEQVNSLARYFMYTPADSDGRERPASCSRPFRTLKKSS